MEALTDLVKRVGEDNMAVCSFGTLGNSFAILGHALCNMNWFQRYGLFRAGFTVLSRSEVRRVLVAEIKLDLLKMCGGRDWGVCGRLVERLSRCSGEDQLQSTSAYGRLPDAFDSVVLDNFDS